jgi:hypothetical protein
MRKGQLPQDGDIYAVPLPANAQGLRYSAVRILGANRADPETDPRHMIALTQFIGANLPELDDPTLLEVLRRQSPRRSGEAAIMLCCGALPLGTIKVGNLPLSVEERAARAALGGR